MLELAYCEVLSVATSNRRREMVQERRRGQKRGSGESWMEYLARRGGKGEREGEKRGGQMKVRERREGGRGRRRREEEG